MVSFLPVRWAFRAPAMAMEVLCFFFSRRRRHTRWPRDWSSDVCSSDLAARQSDGALVWKNTCLGATQAIEIIRSFLYKGSHAHDCSSVGSFPQVPSGGARHLLVERLSEGSIGPWYPNTSGNPLGPRAFATDSTQLFVGGDFGTVNNKAQQGFTRFGGPPDLTRPRQPKVPTASSITK